MSKTTKAVTAKRNKKATSKGANAPVVQNLDSTSKARIDAIPGTDKRMTGSFDVVFCEDITREPRLISLGENLTYDECEKAIAEAIGDRVELSPYPRDLRRRSCRTMLVHVVDAGRLKGLWPNRWNFVGPMIIASRPGGRFRTISSDVALPIIQHLGSPRDTGRLTVPPHAKFAADVADWDPQTNLIGIVGNGDGPIIQRLIYRYWDAIQAYAITSMLPGTYNVELQLATDESADSLITDYNQMLAERGNNGTDLSSLS